MANEEHLAILQQGVEVWNQWREENAFTPNLSGSDISGMDLLGVNFQRANLRGVNLQRTNLFGANLQEANLQEAKLRETNFIGANLLRANLIAANAQGAKFQEANLQKANLYGVNLQVANLWRANMVESILEQAIVGFTIFADIDLRDTKRLDMVKHHRPSTIGIDTLYKSHGQIPEVFLRGCGVPDSMIEYARALVAAEQPIDYYSCFISHSSHDEALAERLYADLQSKGVRCWYVPHHMQIGEPILSGIDRGIRLHDKLLLILSESSVESGWVEQEVHMALAREKTDRRRVLFPIRIDDAVIESRQGWPSVLRDTIHIGDFRQWKEHDAYQSAFTRLLRDLKAEKA